MESFDNSDPKEDADKLNVIDISGIKSVSDFEYEYSDELERLYIHSTCNPIGYREFIRLIWGSKQEEYTIKQRQDKIDSLIS